MSELSDNEILKLLFEEKKLENAFRLIVERYKERIYRHIRGILILMTTVMMLLKRSLLKSGKTYLVLEVKAVYTLGFIGLQLMNR